jgi:hypothetical protein
MTRLNPLVGVEQFAGGQDMARQRLAMQARQRLEEQAQLLRQQQMAQQAAQQQQEMLFRQQQEGRRASEFGQRQDLDERQFAGLQQERAQKWQEDQRQQTGLGSYLEALASDVEQKAGGVQLAPPVPEQRPRTSYDEDRSAFGGDASVMAAHPAPPNNDQVYARTVAAQIRQLRNLPPQQALMMARQLQQQMQEREMKQKQAEVLRGFKSPYAAKMAEGIQADLDQGTLAMMLRDLQRQQDEFNATNPNSPQFQQNVRDVMALNPNTKPEQAMAYVRARNNGLVNQDRGNLSGQVRDDTLTELRRDIEALTKGSDWEADPETKALVADLRTQYRQAVQAKYAKGGAPADGQNAGEPDVAQVYRAMVRQIVKETAEAGKDPKKLNPHDLHAEVMRRLQQSKSRWTNTPPAK